MLIFDIETNGLIPDVTAIHCLVIYDTETDQTITYNDQAFKKSTDSPASEPIVRGIQHLEDSDAICGHNIIGYDLPVIKRLYPWFGYPPICIDTLLLSRLYHSNMIGIDKKHNWNHMPLGLYGRHSLESYGYRLGEFKGSFSTHTDWKDWSPEMEDYCRTDVSITNKLWKHFQKKLIH
jgi:hypothetical protein|tara:strand:+ start:350 stop:883 length:534 start_codon:yes stop_codon:yes gene_type:complete